MAETGSIRGRLVQYERPHWDPLLNLLGVELAGQFMWMCEVRLDDETTIHAYKHAMTRRYLHLDAGGRAFHYDESIGYTDIAGPIAIARAFVGWERSWSTDREKAALRDAMCRARRGLDFRYHAP